MDQLLTPFAGQLVRVRLVRLSRLCVVTEDGRIVLPGELVFETDRGFLSLSYRQDGLVCHPPVPQAELRWSAGPDLRFGPGGSAEEWLEVLPLEGNHPLPLTVEAMAGWFGTGPYPDVFALALRDSSRELVLATTDDGDLISSTRELALRRAERVTRNMNQRLVYEETGRPAAN